MKELTKAELLEMGWYLVKLELYPTHLDEADKQIITSMKDLVDRLRKEQWRQ